LEVVVFLQEVVLLLGIDLAMEYYVEIPAETVGIQPDNIPEQVESHH
jgi:hypothetical protein